MTSVLTSLIIVFGGMAPVECCIIPCIRGLVLRVIETALTAEEPSEQLLLLDTVEHELQTFHRSFALWASGSDL